MDAACLHDEIKSVAVRHEDVDNSRVAMLSGHEFECGLHVRSTHDFETKSGEHVSQMLQHEWIIVDDADFHPTGPQGLC